MFKQNVLFPTTNIQERKLLFDTCVVKNFILYYINTSGLLKQTKIFSVSTVLFFTPQLKSKVGNILTKVTTLRINLNMRIWSRPVSQILQFLLLVSHNTDTPFYVFPLALAFLSTIINKND